MENVISGKLDYLKMVKGVENNLYLKLFKRFTILINSHSHKDSDNRVQYLNSILNISIENGINEAMTQYKAKQE
jgi:hypothetical protein